MRQVAHELEAAARGMATAGRAARQGVRLTRAESASLAADYVEDAVLWLQVVETSCPRLAREAVRLVDDGRRARTALAARAAHLL